MAEQKQASRRKPSNKKKQVEEPQPVSAKVEGQAGSFQSRPSNAETVDKSEIMKKYDERLEAAVIDAQYMMVYASTNCPNEMPPDITEKLIQIRQKIAKGEEIEAPKEAEFWQNYQILWKLVQPINSTGFTVTADSIKANMELETTIFGRKISKSRKAVNRYIASTAVILILLLFFQIYSVVGTQLTTELNELSKKRADLTAELSTNEKEYRAIEIRFMQESSIPKNTGTAIDFHNTAEWLRDTLENRTSNANLNSSLESVNSQLDRNLINFSAWSSLWDWLIDVPQKIKEALRNWIKGISSEKDNAVLSLPSPQQTSDTECTTQNIGGEHILKYQTQFYEVDRQIAEIQNQCLTGAQNYADALNEPIKNQINQIDSDYKDVQDKIAKLSSEQSDKKARLQVISDFKEKNDELLKLGDKWYSTPSGSDEEKIAEKEIQDFKDVVIPIVIDGKEILVSLKCLYGMPTNIDNQSSQPENCNSVSNTDDDVWLSLSPFVFYNVTTPDFASEGFSKLHEEETNLQSDLSKLQSDLDAKIKESSNLNSSKETLNAQTKRASDVIKLLNGKLKDLFAQREILITQEEDEIKRESELAHQLPGQSVLNIIQSYILPILYGLLGASTDVLRTLSRKVKNVTYSDTTGIHILSIALGALAGIVVGWFSFFFGGDKTSFLGSVSPLAIAFLVGYNIEFFFSKMDGFLKDVTDTPIGSPNSQNNSPLKSIASPSGKGTSRKAQNKKGAKQNSAPK